MKADKITCLAALLLSSGAVLGGSEFRLSTAEDLVQLSSAVASGETFDGTTVLLESDIEFPSNSSPFTPIGDFEHPFLGTFDGQGNTVSGLTLSAASKYVALFGFARGATVRSVVLGETCTVTSRFDAPSDAYVGSAIAYCTAYYGRCVVASVVNLASVTFAGDVRGYTLALGGIAGHVYSHSHAIVLTNCVNYGALAIPECNASRVSAGGLAGHFEGYSPASTNAVRNSANFGGIAAADGAAPLELLAGGLLGRALRATVENCVSGARVAAAPAAGALVGCANATRVAHSFWTPAVGREQAWGAEPDAASSLENSSLAAADAELAESLNAHPAPAGEKWGRWVLGAENATATMTTVLNGQRGVVLAADLLLLVEPSGGDVDVDDDAGRAFSGWFADGTMARPFTEEALSKDTTVYGAYGVLVNVSFDAGNGTLSQKKKVVAYGKRYGELPVPKIAENEFVWWLRTVKADGLAPVQNDTVVEIAKSHVLRAGWMWCNVTFDMGGGSSQTVRVRYDEEIKYPKDPKRKGLKFEGWKNPVNTTMGVDVTITALWAKKTGMSSGMIAVCVVVPIAVILVVVVAVVVIVVTARDKRKKKVKYIRVRDEFYNNLIDSSSYSE